MALIGSLYHYIMEKARQHGVGKIRRIYSIAVSMSDVNVYKHLKCSAVCYILQLLQHAVCYISRISSIILWALLR